MTKLSTPKPWFKFNPRDWRQDLELRPCSLAARGLWLEILCVAHESPAYGHLLVRQSSGAWSSPSIEQLAKIAGVQVKDATVLLTELEQAGVFSRTVNGVIFSRRMVRDAERSLEGREHAEKRWGQPEAPLLGEGDAPPIGYPNRGTQSHPHMGQPMAEPKGYPIAPLMLESESESESKSSRNLVLQSTTPANGSDAIFDRFCKLANISFASFRLNTQWLNLPSAIYSWAQAGADKELDVWPTIERLTLAHVASQGRIPNSPTYFNRAIIEARDQRLASAQHTSQLPSKRYPELNVKGTSDYWNYRLDLMDRTGFWADYEDGPAPGKSGCKVPNYVLAARAKPA